MSASYHRPKPTPVKGQVIDSLMMTPPTPERLHELLSDVSRICGWTAYAVSPAPEAGFARPDREMLDEAEEALILAYTAVYAMRGETRQ